MGDLQPAAFVLRLFQMGKMLWHIPETYRGYTRSATLLLGV